MPSPETGKLSLLEVLRWLLWLEHGEMERAVRVQFEEVVRGQLMEGLVVMGRSLGFYSKCHGQSPKLKTIAF